MFKVSLLTAVLVFSSLTQAKEFSNGFIKFELPAGWQCVIEGSEWVCQSENLERKKEAIIILAAKKRGPQDTLAEYMAYLKQAKTYSLPGGKTQRSEPKTVDKKVINGLPWIDALHMASEVPGFYTRYLAATKADIGVAVTFSVTKSLYSAYKEIFDSVISSMRIIRQTNIQLSGVGKIKPRAATDNIGEVTFDPVDDQANIGSVSSKTRKGEGGSEEDLLIFLVLAGIVAFVFYKKKMANKGSKKTKKKRS